MLFQWLNYVDCYDWCYLEEGLLIQTASLKSQCNPLLQANTLNFCFSWRQNLFQTICALPCSSLPTSHPPTGKSTRTNSCCYLLFQLKPKHFRCWFIWPWCDIHVQCKKKAGIWKRDNFVLFPTGQLSVIKNSIFFPQKITYSRKYVECNPGLKIQIQLLALLADTLSSAEKISIPKLSMHLWCYSPITFF